MKTVKYILAVLLGTTWISISEFFRNEVLVKQLWEQHYRQLGIVFPNAALNGAIWGVWALLLAVGISVIIRKFTLVQATLVAWLMAFVMMWVAIGNLNVLPYQTLIYAIPLSLLEVFVAAFIIKKVQPTEN